jgi:hypothetical protein
MMRIFLGKLPQVKPETGQNDTPAVDFGGS